MNALLQNNLISTKEAAKRSGYSADYVSRLCREEKINAVQVGRTWLIEWDSLETFMGAQLDRKIELAESLARERGREYQKANTTGVQLSRFTRVLEEKTVEALSPLVTTLSRSLEHSASVFAGPAFATALTALVLIGGVFLAGTGVVAQAGRTFVAQSFAARAHVLSAIENVDTHFAKNTASLALFQKSEEEKRVALFASAANEQIASLPVELLRTAERAHEPVTVVAQTFDRADAVAATYPNAITSEELIAFVSNPKEAVAVIAEESVAAYLRIGAYALRDIATITDIHANLIGYTSDALLTSVTAVRDLPQTITRTEVALGTEIIRVSDTILATYEKGIYAYVESVETLPRVLVGTTLELGTGIANSVAVGVIQAPHVYTDATIAFARESSSLAEAISTGSFAFGSESHEAVHGLLAAEDRTISQGVQALETGSGALVQDLAYSAQFLTAIPRQAEIYTLGVAGRIAVALERNNQPLQASPLAAVDVTGYMPTAVRELPYVLAQATRNLFHGVLGPIARFFDAMNDVGVAVIPFDDVVIERPSGDMLFGLIPVTGTTTTTIIGNNGPVTIVRNEYPTVTYVGASEAYVDERFEFLRRVLYGRIEEVVDRLDDGTGNSGGSGGTGITSLDGLSGTGLTLTNSTWNGGTISASSVTTNTLTAGTTTITGNSTINGDLSVTGTLTAGTLAVSSLSVNGPLVGPYFTATSTTATSTFPNLASTNAVITNATTTNFFATTARFTNGVIDSLTAPLATITDAIITNLTATNAVITNGTTTNATSTNFYSQNAVAQNATTTNLFTTNARITNGVIDSLTATNAVITNGTTTNATSTNQFTQNLVATNATTTNFFATTARITTGVIDSLTAPLAMITDAIITNLTATNATLTNATSTNATSTNLYAQNAVTQNATSTTFFATNLRATIANIVDAFFTNITADLATLTNALITNLTATNATLTNATSTNATSTNLFVQRLVSTNATSTNFFATTARITNGVIDSLTAPFATLTDAAITNLTGTNAVLTNATTTHATTTGSFALTYATPGRLLSTNADGLVQSANLATWVGGTANQIDVADNGSGGVTLSLPATIIFGSGQPTTLGSNGATSTFGGGVDASQIYSHGYIAGPYVIAASTTATSAFSGNIAVGRNTTLGTSGSDSLIVNSRIASNLVPASNLTYSLGSASNYWKEAFIEELNVNNIAVASTSISGTASEVFTINSDNATNDLEDMSLVFNRGLAPESATITWNTATQRFEFNMPIFSDNAIFTNATNTTLRVTGSATFNSGVTVNGETITDFTGSNLTNSGGSLGLSASYAGQSSITTVGTITSGTWNGTTIGVPYGGTGATSLTGLLIGNGTGAFTATTTSAGLASILSNETGTGQVVFNDTPTFLGTATFNIASGTGAIFTNGTSTNLFVQRLVSTNATSTNLFATTARITTGVIDALTAPLATITDAIITNLTATNATLTNATTTNATSTNLFATNFRATTSTVTALNATNASTTALTNASALYNTYLTAGRVPYTTTAGLLTDNANLTFNGTTLTANALALTNALSVANGGTGATSLTGLLIGNGTGAFTATTTSAGLASILSNETGTGQVVFNDTPTFTGTAIFASATTTNLRIAGRLYDGTHSAGTAGQILQSTGSGVAWVATSSFAGSFFVADGNSFGRTAVLGTNDSQNLELETAGETQLTIDTTGNVGIGTNNPLANFHVQSNDFSGTEYLAAAFNNFSLAANSATRIRLGNSTNAVSNTVGGATDFISTRQSDGSADFSISQSLSTTTLATRFYINGASGNVGIGTQSPLARLSLVGVAGTDIFGIASSSGTRFLTVTSNGELGLGTSSPSGFLTAVSTTTGPTFVVEQKGAGAAAFFLGGNTGFGTTTPNDTVSVQGTFNLTGAFKVNGDAGTAGTILKSNGAGAPTWVATSTLGIALSDTTGVLAVNRGGTGVSTLPAVGQLLIGNNSGGYTVAGLTGTSNQITVSSSSGSITLSTPQNIHTSALPQFLRLGLGAAADSNIPLVTTATGTAARFVNSSTTSAGNFARIMFAANRSISGATDVASIQGVITETIQSQYKGALTFSTANNSTPIERMRIDHLGNVGIGTTTGSTSPFASRLTVMGTSTSATTTLFLVASSSNDSLFAINYDGSVAFNNQVGTAGQFLQSMGAGAAPQWVSTSTLAGSYFVQNGNSFNQTAVLGTNDNNDLQFETNGSARVTINTSGYLGIGTQAPTASLHVESNAFAGSEYLAGVFNNASASTNSATRIRLGNSTTAISNATGGATDFISTRQSDGSADFSLSMSSSTSGLVTRFYIDGSTGNVGIGSSTPSEKLTVGGAVRATNFYTTTVAELQTAITNAATGDIIYVKTESASSNQINITSKTDLIIDGQGATITLTNGSNSALFNISGGARITIRNFNFAGPNTGTYNATNPHRGIFIDNDATHIRIENSSFTGFDSNGIYVNNSGGTNDTNGVTIDSNTFHDFPNTGTTTQAAVAFGDEGEYSTVSNSRFEIVPYAIRATAANITIRNNVITHSNGGPTSGAASITAGLIYVYPGTNSGKFLIQGNQINHNSRNVIPINVTGSSTKPENNFIITDNYVLVNTNGSDTRQQFRGAEIDNSVIANNTFRPTPSGTAADVVVELIDSENVKLVGNTIFGGTYSVRSTASTGNTTSISMLGNSLLQASVGSTTASTSGTGLAYFDTSINTGANAFFANNVGIGTTTPSSKLTVAGNVLAQYFTATSSSVASVFPLASTTALTNSSALYNTYLTSGRLAYTTTNGLLTDSSALTFNGTTLTATGLSSTNASTTNLTISGRLYDSRGLAGTAGQFLQSTGTSTMWVSTTTILGGSYFVHDGNTLGMTAIIGTNDANNLEFETTGVSRAVLDTNGNFGIGTLSPLANLHLESASSSGSEYFAALFNNYSTAANSATRIRLGNSVSGIGSNIGGATDFLSTRQSDGSADFSLSISSSTSAMNTRLFIDGSTGNIGIGTTTPGQRLTVGGGNLQISPGVARQSYILSGRTDLTYPVPYITSAEENSIVAFDIFPRGTPTNIGTNGYAWMDICDADVVNVGTPFNCLRAGINEDAVTYGNLVFGTTSVQHFASVVGTTTTSFFGVPFTYFATTTGTSTFDVALAPKPIVFFGGTGGNEVLRITSTASSSVYSSRMLVGNIFGGHLDSRVRANLHVYSDFASTSLLIGARGASLGSSTAATTSTATLAFRTLDISTDVGNAVEIVTGRDSLYNSAGNRDANLQFWVELDDDLVERLRITSAGFVGVGTSSPLTRFEVSGSSSTVNPLTFTSAITSAITNTGTTTNNFSALSFRTLDNGSQATTTSQILGIHTSHASTTGASGALAFFTTNAGVAAERMRIDATGQITGQYFTSSSSSANTFTNASTSVLTTATAHFNTYLTAGRVPYTTTNGLLTDNAALTFNGTTLTATGLSSTNASTTNLTVSGRFYDSAGLSGTNGQILLSTGSATTWVATSSLGISTSTLSLDTQYFKQNGNSFGALASLGTNDANSLSFKTNGTERMRIDTSGNVGIGSTTPGILLSLYASSTGTGRRLIDVTNTDISSTQNASIGITSNDTTGSFITYGSGYTSVPVVAGGSYVQNNGTNAHTGLLTIGTNGYIHFVTGATSPLAAERMRIDVNGNVGIGSSTPSAKLSVHDNSGAASTTALFAIASSTSGNLATSTLFSVLGNGSVGIGSASTALINAIGATGVTISNTLSPGLGIENSAASGATSGGGIGLYSNDGAAMASGDRLGALFFGGASSASTIRNTAIINAVAAENWVDSSAYGTDLVFQTTATGVTLRSEKMRLSSTGNLGIGSSTPGARLVVSGQTIGQYFTATSTTLTNTFSLASTSILTVDTGLYNTYLTSGRVPYTTTNGLLTDNANLTFNGTQLSVNTLALTNALTVANGGTGVSSQVSNGVAYYNGTNITTGSGFVYTGTNVGIGSSTPSSLLTVGGTVTADYFAASSSDSAALPGHTWSGDTNTGMFHSAADQIGFTAGGTNSVTITATGLAIGTTTSNATLDVARNTSVVPGANLAIRIGAVSSNAAWGIRLNASNDLVIDRNSSNAWTQAFTFERSTGNLAIGSSSLSLSTRLTVAGTATADYFNATSADSTTLPGYTWTGDLNTGLYHPAADTIGIVTGGTERLTIGSTGNIGIGSSTPGSKLAIAGGTIWQTGAVPSEIASTSLLAQGRGIAVSGKYAYTTQSVAANGLHVIDISNPYAPTSTAVFSPAAAPLGRPVIAGNYLFIGMNSTSNSIQVINISNPVSPATTTVINNGLGVGALEVSGHYLFAGGFTAAGTATFTSYDIANPASPANIGSITLTGVVAVESMVIRGNYAYLAEVTSGAGQMQIIDISNPAAPAVVASYPTTNAIYAIGVVGRYAYLGSSNSTTGLEIVDVANPAAPVTVSTFATSRGMGAVPNSLSVVGKYLYFPGVSGSNNFQTIDVSNPAAPASVGTMTAGQSVGVTAVVGKYLFSAINSSTTPNGFKVYDIAGAILPSATIGSVDTDALFVTGAANFANDVYVQGGLSAGSGGIFSRGGLSVYVASSTATNPVAATFMGGNVGIGTTSPSAKLAITGTAGTGDIFAIASSTNARFFTVASTGNVGIGSSTPGAKLSITGAGTGTGINFQTTNSSNAALVTMLDNGSVGIGTTSPLTKLHLQATTRTTAFVPGGGAASWGDFTIVNQTDTLNAAAGIRFSVDAAVSDVAGIAAVKEHATNAALGLAFIVDPDSSGPIEALRINNAGNVGIGTSSPIAKLSVHDTSGAVGTTSLFTIASSTSANLATTTLFTILGNGNVGIGTTTPASQLTTTGSVRFTGVGAGSVTIDADGNLSASSDERLKNIDGAFNRGLASIMDINPISYHWKEFTGYDTDFSYTGFSAQNIQASIPEAIMTDSRGYLTLNDRPILAAAINAVKELAGRTETLATSTLILGDRLTTIEGKLTEVEGPEPVTATTIVGNTLTITGTGSFDMVDAAGTISATAFTTGATALSFEIGDETVTADLPSEVLTGGDADLFKMASYALAQTQTLAMRTDLIIERLESIEERLAAMEATASSTPATVGLSLASLQDVLDRVGIVIEDGIASFNNLVFRQLAVAKDEDGSSSAGSMTLLAGNTTIEVDNVYVLPTSKIFVTFTSPVTGAWYISHKETGSFRVTLDTPQLNDVSFDYFILQTEGQLASPAAAQPEQPEVPEPTTPFVPVFPETGSTTPETGTSTPNSDTRAPFIRLNGNAATELDQGQAWTDPGAEANDDVDGDLTAQIQVSGTVNTAVAGLYTISYSVSDAAGNEGHVSRIVTVTAGPTPVVTPAPTPEPEPTPAPEPTI